MHGKAIIATEAQATEAIIATEAQATKAQAYKPLTKKTLKIDSSLSYRYDSIGQMEKHINGISEKYTTTFKDVLKKKIIELGIQHTPANELIEFIYEYPRLIFEKNDLTKRKRVKNAIPELNRCNALRASGEQCTRRRKDGHEYCGTHTKGIPNGSKSTDTNHVEMNKKMEVFAQDMNGIIYYIDAYNNVYKTEDILSGKVDPRIIANYTIENGIYRVHHHR